MKIKQRKISQLIPYAGNARTHSAAQINRIAASITEFGWTNPILLDGNNGIIAGHGRLLAAQQLGMTDVPCIDLAHLTPTQKRAYILADNKLALQAGWDQDLLKLELRELADSGFDIDLAGFSEAELKSALGIVDVSDAQSQINDALSYSIVVDCGSERDQASMLEKFEREGYKCRPLIS